MNDFRTMDFTGLQIDVLAGWEQPKGPDGNVANEGRAPFFLVRRQLGTGVFQLSPALFTGGTPPNVTTALLLNMAERFGRARDLGPTSDVEITETPPGGNRESGLMLIGVSFRPREKFIRLWHGSDGLNFAFLSYGCDADKLNDELDDCLRMATTMRFRDTAPAAPFVR